MAFRKFKERHGGNGPIAEAYGAVTGGEGLFGMLGMQEERELTDRVISQVQSNKELEGLAALAESGRAPLTREQHTQFRAGLMQSALNLRVVGEFTTAFSGEQTRLKANAVGANDLEILGVLDAQGDYAAKLMRSNDPTLRASGAALMGNVWSEQRTFASNNEQQRLQVDASEAAGRNEKRKEFQSALNSRVLDPLTQDHANYSAIANQLIGEGEEIAPSSLVSTVLDYAGAQLGVSDEGRWSFKLGGIGLGSQSIPSMTYSQLRNRLDAAHQGRASSLQGAASEIIEQARLEKFAVNGTEVTDVVFPLADQIHKERELEIAPPTLADPAAAQTAGSEAATAVTGAIAGFGRGIAEATGIDKAINLPITNALEWIDNAGQTLKAKGEELLTPNSAAEPAPRRRYRPQLPGTRGGVYVPEFMRRPTND